MYCHLFAVFFLMLAPCAFTQVAPPMSISTGNLKVHVTFTDDRAANIRAHVELMSGMSNNPVAESFTNDQGMAEFFNVQIGNYHLVVTGEGIEKTESSMFEVDFRKLSQHIFVSVKRLQESEPAVSEPLGQSISASDLKIPENAKKEFDNASELIAREDWKNAIERLNKALAIYPNYVEAYNNLGVAYSRLGDRFHEREALQKAISLNDHFAPALVNLARISMIDRNYPEAETLLSKATIMDPATQALTLLAQVQLLNGHYDDAIASSRKVHLRSHKQYAVVHYIAARAFEHQKRAQDAVGELETFLKEEPEGERSVLVRKELANLQAQLR
jgi:tetratricopeptide (TPR) repeat protein